MLFVHVRTSGLSLFKDGSHKFLDVDKLHLGQVLATQ
jgi:hypothetical protein